MFRGTMQIEYIWDYQTNILKVAEDDIAFKLAISKKSLHLNDNTGFCSIIQASKLDLGLYWHTIGKK